jgi:BMFP domain-containing protein YqiC
LGQLVPRGQLDHQALLGQLAELDLVEVQDLQVAKEILADTRALQVLHLVQQVLQEVAGLKVLQDLLAA